MKQWKTDRAEREKEAVVIFALAEAENRLERRLQQRPLIEKRDMYCRIAACNGTSRPFKV